MNTFRELWAYTVSGSVQAQPLYLQNLTIGGASHNVLFVVTMNDIVYAFNADSSSNTPLWSVDLTKEVSGATPVPIVDIVQSNSLNVVGNVGIESTPVIDPSTNTMYLVARTKESGVYYQRLHALDITTGAEKFGGPSVISGSVSGNGTASSGGVLAFNPLIENQRPGLALANGQILIGWASHEDLNPYHGWVMSYSASTLAQTGIFCTTPSGSMGGVWMSGRAPAVDTAGNVYYMSGNGTWDGSTNFSEAILKFSTTSGLALTDWFTPDNYAALTNADEDLGSSGPILIPGTDFLVGGGKQSAFYLMHTGSLGHENGTNGQIAQTLSMSGETHAGPVYWNRSGGVGPWLYNWPNHSQPMTAYHFNGTTFDTAAVSTGSVIGPSGQSGGVLTLSANGSTAGTGVIWASMPTSADGDHGVNAGILRAVNADNLTQELWNSNQNAARDSVGNWPKYSAPLVENGRVYAAGFPADGVSSGTISVYGLLSASFAVAATPASQLVVPGSSASYTVTVTPIGTFSGAVSLNVTGVPSGASATVTANGTAGVSTLKVTTTSTITPGTYAIAVTGVSGTLSASANVTLVVSSTAAGKGAVSVNFVGSGNMMAASESAGVVSKFNWNQALTAAGTLSLVDETGTATGASVTWSAPGAAPTPGIWSLPITDAPNDVRMMEGYLDPIGGSATAAFSGLPATTYGYDVYVYADGDNATATRTASYQISGTGITTTSATITDNASTNFSGGYVLANNSAGNYVKFSVNAPQFTITATAVSASDNTLRAPLNGIEIVPRTTSITPTGLNVISLDLVGSGTVMASTETAGVVASTHWNAAQGAKSSSALKLVDSTGAATSATATWSSNGTYSLPIANTAGNDRMMQGYLDPTSGTATVTVTGLATHTAGYNVYVYVDGNNGSATRTGSYKITGPGLALAAVTATDEANTNFSGTFTQANNSKGNYVVFAITGTQFTLTATPGTASTSTKRAPINGIQIVPK